MKAIDDLINGNLTDARKSAQRISHAAIQLALRDEYGWDSSRALAAADYLKGLCTFQSYCNATARIPGNG